MKKRIIGIVAVLLIVCSGVSLASEKDGVEVEAGIKGWYNKLELKSPEGKIKFDSTVWLGPVAEVKLPIHIFFEASYLMSLADYKDSLPLGKLEADRKDFEAAAGYQLIPQLALYLGYKNAKSDFTETDISGEISKSSSKLYGFLAGLRGNVPVNEMVSVYANAAYLRTKTKLADIEISGTENSPGYDAELGLKLEFVKHVSGNLGYRMESTKGRVSKERETFSGITFGGMYAFE